VGGADDRLSDRFRGRATNLSACAHSFSLVCDREILAILSKSAATATSALAADNVIEPIAIGDRQAAYGSASKNLTTL
jgi:hypothetical protein